MIKSQGWPMLRMYPDLMSPVGMDDDFEQCKVFEYFQWFPQSVRAFFPFWRWPCVLHGRIRRDRRVDTPSQIPGPRWRHILYSFHFSEFVDWDVYDIRTFYKHDDSWYLYPDDVLPTSLAAANIWWGFFVHIPPVRYRQYRPVYSSPIGKHLHSVFLFVHEIPLKAN